MKLEDFREPIKSQPVAYILVGLPGSGKSTWLRNKLQHENLMVVSSDDEIEKFAKTQGKSYSQVFDEYIKMATSNMYANLNSAIKDDISIAWDQTNLSLKKRKSILQKIPKHYKKVAVIFDIDDQVLTDRLYNRAKIEGKYIPNHVIERMKSTYVKPTTTEGFDEVIEV